MALTPEQQARAEQVAQSLPPPSAATIARMRAVWVPTTPAEQARAS